MERNPAESPVGDGRQKRRGGCLLKLLVVLVVIGVAAWFFLLRPESPEKFSWPTTGLAAMLPTPEETKGKIRENTDDRFSANLEEASSDDYWAYLDACKEKGFTVDSRQDTSTSYEAYSQDGYALELLFWGSSLDVSLDAPIEMDEIDWPTTGPGSLVPAPASTVGVIRSDSARSFSALVGETTVEEFAEYCDAVAAAGFAEDYSRDGSSYYRAENATGDQVSITYEGFSTIAIQVTLADEEESDEAKDTVAASAAADDAALAAGEGADDASGGQEGQDAGAPADEQGQLEEGTEPAPEAIAPADEGSETPEASADASLPSGVAPAFKATMDAYESFFDEYVDFMLRYEEGGSSVQMLVDYSSMMARYAETMQSLDEIDSDSLSAADAAYYAEVMARITARLAELSE